MEGCAVPILDATLLGLLQGGQLRLPTFGIDSPVGILRGHDLSDDQFKLLLNWLGQQPCVADGSWWVNPGGRDIDQWFTRDYAWLKGIHLPFGVDTQSYLATGLDVGYSVHSYLEAQAAAKAGVQWVLLSPIRATQSHPNGLALGGQKREKIVQFLRANSIAIYGLGGLAPADVKWAQDQGMAGVAGIRNFWPQAQFN